MSFILDALRKSEIERQRQHGPSIAEFAGARSDSRSPWALAAIGALLALNVGVILFFLFRDAKQEAPPAAASADAAPQAPAPATAPQPVNATPDIAPAAAPPAVTQQQLAAALEPLPAAPESSLPPAAPDPTLVPAPPAGSPGVRYDNAPPSSDALAVQAAEGLPELSMDLHIFSADRSKRAVFINGRRYTEGATLAEGPVVEEITREGAVLNYRGRRFVLPRL